MFQMLVRRLLATIPMLIFVTFLVFSLSALLPGDPAVAIAGGEAATPERIEQVRTELGLDRPLIVRYGEWLGDAVRGDFGTSLFDSRFTVSEEIKTRLPVTGSIALLALVLGLVIGLPVGVASGMKPGRLVDRVGVGGTSLGISLPNFFVAMLLAMLFAVKLGWLPAIGFKRFSDTPVGWLKSAFMPALALALGSGAAVARQTRAALIDVMGSNYVRTAWATGGRPAGVVGVHALKNAAIPAITVIGLQLGALIGGTVLVEQIFVIPGLGSYLLRGLLAQDIPVIQGVTVFFVFLQMLITLLLDISYGYLNPKVRVS